MYFFVRIFVCVIRVRSVVEVRGGVGVFGFNYRRFNCYCLFIFFLSRFLGCLGGMGFIVYGG